MASKGIITSAQETVVAAGKSTAEGAKVLAGEVAHVAAMAGATATAAAKAAGGVLLDKVEMAIEASKPGARTTITIVRETALVAVKGAAKGAKAVATRSEDIAAAGKLLDKFATMMEAKKGNSRATADVQEAFAATLKVVALAAKELAEAAEEMATAGMLLDKFAMTMESGRHDDQKV
jgi:hypothetical protein